MTNFKLLLFIVPLFAIGCAHMNPPKIDPQTLDVPTGELQIVQHEEKPAARASNPLYLPNRRVRAPEFGTPALAQLIAQMHKTLIEKAGVGIAANQVGKNLQVFMIEAKADNPRYKVLGAVPFEVFINPRIAKASAEKNNFWHGCLSAVGKKRGNVATYDWIDVEAQDASGAPFRRHLTGFAAVIFQHEFRHMLGGTYLDHAKTYLDKEELDRKVKLKELPFFERAAADLPLLIDDYVVGETLEEYYKRTR